MLAGLDPPNSSVLWISGCAGQELGQSCVYLLWLQDTLDKGSRHCFEW